jgi:chemotaxis protein MotB
MPAKKKPEAEKENAERWLLTYADMITLLLALFVVLYATSKADPIKFQQIAVSLQRAFNIPVLEAQAGNSLISIGDNPTSYVGLTGVGAVIGPELISYAQKEDLGDQITVTASRDAVVIELAGALVFGSGSAELRPEARQALEIVANTITTRAQRHPIRVEGHTDDTPPNAGRFPTNWELSAARAGAAARFLAEAGVPGDTITAVGYAETKPIGDNNTPEGKTRNRRVEIWILNPEPIGPTSVAPRTSTRVTS